MPKLLFLFTVVLARGTAQELFIAAASDLSPLESALRESFKAHSPAQVRFTFGSSGMLARQIRSGAPFDVYLSANEQFVNDLAKDGLMLTGSVYAYATGRVGLWSATGKVLSLKDLTRSEVRHISLANPDHAPYGVAAEQLLRREGLWDQIHGKLVLAENVRQAFEFARTGNADAVLTSWTLLFDKAGILLPDSGHAPIRQSGGVIKGTKNEAAAKTFMEFLSGADGRKVLARFGLFPPQLQRGR